MVRLYVRCNGGDFFLLGKERGVHCPLDGWTFPGFKEVQEIAQRIEESGERLTIQLLRDSGVPENVLQRVILIEFGDTETEFEALTPAGYQLHGKWWKLRDVDNRFM